MFYLYYSIYLIFWISIKFHWFHTNRLFLVCLISLAILRAYVYDLMCFWLLLENKKWYIEELIQNFMFDLSQPKLWLYLLDIGSFMCVLHVTCMIAIGYIDILSASHIDLCWSNSAAWHIQWHASAFQEKLVHSDLSRFVASRTAKTNAIVDVLLVCLSSSSSSAPLDNLDNWGAIIFNEASPASP